MTALSMEPRGAPMTGGGEFQNLECFEISDRFRQAIQKRIERLEKDAGEDEQAVALLRDKDHIRRQKKLVAVERAEVLRLRLFLDRAKIRLPRPLIAL